MSNDSEKTRVNLLEKIVHDVSIVLLIALRHEANGKDDNSIQSISIVTYRSGKHV